jgi:hypothetical protein
MRVVYSGISIHNETDYLGFLIRGRRWYQPRDDTTYHRAYIYAYTKDWGKVPLEATAIAVGGGLEFLRTAGNHLLENGYLKASEKCDGEFMLNGLCLEGLSIDYVVQDVDFMEDL